MMPLEICRGFEETEGIVVLEALASGTPVIASTKTPWESIVENDCGWQCEPTVDSIRETLAKAMSIPEAELDGMGRRGIRFVEQNYSWRHSVQLLLDAYKGILGQ